MDKSTRGGQLLNGLSRSMSKYLLGFKTCPIHTPMKYQPVNFSEHNSKACLRCVTNSATSKLLIFNLGLQIIHCSFSGHFIAHFDTHVKILFVCFDSLRPSQQFSDNK